MYEYFRPDLYNYTHTHKQGKPQENEKIISKEKSMRETIIHKTSHKELALKQDKPSYKKRINAKNIILMNFQKEEN